MRPNERGYSLTEVLVTMAITSCLALVANAAIDSARRSIDLSGGTAMLRGTLQYARTSAIARRRNVAVRFRQDGTDWSWGVYEDGDGDGVRNDDIAKGIDRPLQLPRTFELRAAHIGMPPGNVLDPVTGELLSKRAPVRFGNSLLCSFDRFGEATNGSVVVTDGHTATLIKVAGDSGRISVVRWNGEKWIGD